MSQIVEARGDPFGLAHRSASASEARTLRPQPVVLRQSITYHECVEYGGQYARYDRTVDTERCLVRLWPAPSSGRQIN
jgi:hypothetical protein